jgi:D-glycero-D-manno-heptose 1,7-bisphosphate phosphatase
VKPTAAFLDRDGTLIEDADYPSDPNAVRLLPGAARAVQLLNEAHVPVVVITNQSGIARGMYGEEEYEAVRARLDELLGAEGARVDATYHCPHHPEFTGPCDCRKPGIALYERAVRDLGLPHGGALFVGDRLRDLLPARALGGRGVLVESPSTPAPDRARADAEFETAESLLALVESVLAD